MKLRNNNLHMCHYNTKELLNSKDINILQENRAIIRNRTVDETDYNYIGEIEIIVMTNVLYVKR